MILASHLGRPKGKPEPGVQPEAGRRAPRRAARPPGGVRAGLRRRPAAERAVPRRGAGRSASAAREPALPRRGGDERPGVRRRRSPRWPTSTSTTPSAPRTAPTPRSTAIVAHARRAPAAGLLMEKELDVPRARRSTSPSGRSSRSSAAPRSRTRSRSSRTCSARVDACSIGGAMAYTFFKAQGLPVGKSLVEDDKLAAAREMLEHAQGDAASSCCCRSITSWPGARRRGADRRCCTVDGSRPSATGWASTSARRPTAALRRDIARREDRGLERPDGRLRDRRVRRRHDAAWRRRWRRVQGTTIVGGGDSVAAVNAGRPRRPDHPHLDRRRRVARVPRRQGAARRGGAPDKQSRATDAATGYSERERRVRSEPTSDEDHAAATHRRQLEDVQDRARGRRAT